MKSNIIKMTTLLATVLLSCQKPVEVIKVTGMHITPSEITLTVGESKELDAVVTPDNASDKRYTVESADNSVVIDFNGSSSGVSSKPSGLVTDYPINPSGTHQFTVRFEPSGDSFCRVIYYVDGIEISSFESSETVMHKVTYGSDINMYVGVDKGVSAVCEWYEYTAPVNWDE